MVLTSPRAVRTGAGDTLVSRYLPSPGHSCQLHFRDVPDLIGLTEIAELLGMTRSGTDKLVKRERSFPEPVGVLAGRTRVWDRADVERWARETGRLK